MLRFLALGLAFVIALFGIVGGAGAQNARAYLSVFQSGRLIAVDPKSGAIIRSIPVEDEAGIAAIASRATDGRLFIVDAGGMSRLRILDPKTFSVLQDVRFQDRMLRFSNYRLLHMSRDGNWLFVHTYRYRDAANGVRVFDVNQGEFAAAELRDLACAEPLLSSALDGTLFAFCPGPGSIQVRSAQASSRGTFSVQASVALPLPLDEIAAVAVTPDGRHAYAVGVPASRGGWQLIHWDRSTGMLDVRNLATVLDLPESELGRFRWAWLGLTQDARQLVFVQGSDAWSINRESLRPSARFKLPSAALGADLIPGSSSLLTIHAAQDRAFNLVTTPLSGEKSQVVRIQTDLTTVPPVSFAVGPSE
jgi:hypothetical protein